MEASSVQRAGGHAITTDRPVSHGSLSELASTTLMANMTTPSTFPPRELQRPSRAYVHPAADEKDRRSHSDPLGASSGGGRKARDATAGGAGGGRLFRWAAALSGGKIADAPHNARQHQRSSSGSSSNGGGSESGGDSAGGAGVAESTAAQAGLFASPLRNRFRPSRRGSKGWSSSSSQAGRGGGNGAGERGGGSAAAGLGSSFILGTLLKSPMAMRIIRHLKMAIALAALTVAGLGALLVGCCLYLTVRPWGRATYRRLLCSQLAAPLVDCASMLLPRTKVRITGDSDMLDGLCPCVIVSNTLPGNAFLGMDWWAILMAARAVGAHGYTKVLVSERLNHTPLLGWILRILEFPGLGDCYQNDRDRVKHSLRSFAKDSVSAGPSGVPYSFLHFPEGDTLNRETLASSLEFAQREGRPELMRLLLPHTTALSACLDGLRPAKPVVYDVTLAAAGYSGEVPCGKSPSDWDILRALVTGRAWDGGGAAPCVEPSCACRPKRGASRRGVCGNGPEGSVDLCSEPSCLCRTGGAAVAGALGFSATGGAGGGPPAADAMGVGGRSLSVGGVSRNAGADWGESGDGVDGGGADRWARGCQDIHVRIKRYSLEEVVGNTHWLDDRWAEKERLLAYFSRHQSFPSDGRGFPARRVIDTSGSQFEGSAMSFVRLCAVLLFVPLLSLAATPFVVSMGCAALAYRALSFMLRAVAAGLLPRRLTRRLWWGTSEEEEEEEEDELGQGYSGRQSTLTPWWGGPTTPLNTPAPGAAGTIPFMTNASGHASALSGHDYMAT